MPSHAAVAAPVAAPVIKELRKRQHKKRVQFRELWNARLANRNVVERKPARGAPEETTRIRAVS